MKKILKFYAVLGSIIAIFLLYGHIVFPLLSASNTVANIMGWTLMPLPMICLWYIIKWLYPLTIQKMKDTWDEI